MNLSGIAPFLGFASGLFGSAGSPSDAGTGSGAAASTDPFSAIMALTQDVDKLATGGGPLGSSIGGGSLVGSISGLLA